MAWTLVTVLSPWSNEDFLLFLPKLSAALGIAFAVIGGASVGDMIKKRGAK